MAMSTVLFLLVAVFFGFVFYSLTKHNRRTRKRRIVRVFMKLLARNLIYILFFIIMATGCTANRLAVADYDLPLQSNTIAAAISAVQVSDLHFRPGDVLNAQVVRAVQELKPDIIVFTGDMIDNRDNLAAFAEYVGSFPKAAHMFAILGNWEYWSHIDLQALAKIYSDNGIRLLINEVATADIRGVSLRIIGLDDLLGGKPSISSINNSANQVVIVLAHCPQLYDAVFKNIPANIRGVMLSGHTHGGQITFFGLPFQLPPGSGNYVAGLYHQGDFPLLVSKGLGTSIYNFRFFAQPDISHVIIR